MPLLELMLSCLIWSGALLAGLQLWGRGAMQRQNQAERAELLRQIERDRLQLQQRWRALPERPCADPDMADFVVVADEQPMAPGLRRVLELSRDEPGLWVRWTALDGTEVLRQRLVTAAGLGRCSEEEWAG